MLIGGTVVSIGFAISTARERDRALEAERSAKAARDAERTQRSEAERQGRIAQAVNDFLNDDLLGSVSPTAQGKDVLMLLQQNKPREAGELLQGAHDHLKESLCLKHPETLAATRGLAKVYDRTGDDPKAKRLPDSSPEHPTPDRPG